MGSTGLTKHPSIEDIKTLLDRGEYDEALNMIEQSDGNRIELQLLKSYALKLKGMHTRALEEVREALDKSRETNNKTYLMNAILHYTHFSLLQNPKQNEIDGYIAEYNEIWNELTDSEKEKEEAREIEGYYYSILALRGYIYNPRNFEGILLELKKGIEIQKQLKHKFNLFMSLNNLIAVYENKGDYQKTFELTNQVKDLAEKLNNRDELARAYGSYGEYYFYTGKYHTSEEYFSKQLEIIKNSDRSQAVSLCYYNFGRLALIKGDYDKAHRALLKSLVIAEDLKHSYMIGTRLFNLILVSLELNSEKLVNNYMRKLQKLNETADYILINFFTELAQALIYKNKSRSQDKAEAQKLLVKIIDKNLDVTISFKYVLLAMLHLSELLLDELKTYTNEEVLKEVEDLTRKIYEMAQERQLFYEIVHILVLRSKLAFLSLELDRAYKILQQAHLIAEERDMSYLIPTIESEEKKLEEEISIALTISKLAAPMQERIEKSKIVNYLTEMQQLINTRN
ncbi:MAG: tetratricopeptide repeat protein [Candidatus Kariarchaeaceae archaeon]|jgi:tetratricopeptide (TPR) repeat protein